MGFIHLIHHTPYNDHDAVGRELANAAHEPGAGDLEGAVLPRREDVVNADVDARRDGQRPDLLREVGEVRAGRAGLLLEVLEAAVRHVRSVREAAEVAEGVDVQRVEALAVPEQIAGAGAEVLRETQRTRLRCSREVAIAVAVRA